jgi:hypothetical protein
MTCCPSHHCQHYRVLSTSNNKAFINDQISVFLSLSLRTLNNQAEEPVRLKKHKVIAQAFAKRKMFNNAGRLSISFHSTYEDPVGKLFYRSIHTHTHKQQFYYRLNISCYCCDSYSLFAQSTKNELIILRPFISQTNVWTNFILISRVVFLQYSAV